MSRESASDVQRQGWRNGGVKKNRKQTRGRESGREEEKHDGGRNLEIQQGWRSRWEGGRRCDKCEPFWNSLAFSRATGESAAFCQATT